MARWTKRTERDDQNAVCAYIKLQYPDLLFMSDIAGDTAPRKVHEARSGKGMPDLLIFKSLEYLAGHDSMANYVTMFNGLALELKAESQRNKITDKDGFLFRSKHILEQDKMHQHFRRNGWLCGFVIGSKAACQIIDIYIKMQAFRSDVDTSRMEANVQYINHLFTKVKSK